MSKSRSVLTEVSLNQASQVSGILVVVGQQCSPSMSSPFCGTFSVNQTVESPFLSSFYCGQLQNISGIHILQIGIQIIYLPHLLRFN